MVNSINTNIAAYFAQANIGIAARMSAASVSRLSSGNRIVQASDDVAALSTGTSLRTQVTTLRTALVNASQGNSLLQVADGALSQITEMLQRQKAIALQAGSGSLTDTDRAYLNQEFQALTAEINRLTQSTTFNGVSLLDGTLSDAVGATSNSTNGDTGEIRLNFTTAPADGDTMVINGVTITLESGTLDAAGEVLLGTSIEETLDNVVAYLNAAQSNTGVTALTAANKLLVSKAAYERDGNSLVINSLAGGNLSEFYRVNYSSGATGTWATGFSVSGRGLETTLTSTAVNVSTIDASATSVFAAGTILIDGVVIYTVVAGDSLRAIVNGINALTGTTGYSAFITGTTGSYNVILRSANTAATGADTGTGLGTVTFAAPVDNNVLSLSGNGSGLGQGSVYGVGSTGGDFSLVTDQTQLFARSVIAFPEIAAGDLTSTTNFGTTRTITIEGQTFTFTTTDKSNKAQTEITIGATLQETLDNAVEAINAFSGLASVNYSFRQIQARREGNNVVIENRQVGNALDIAAGTLTVAASLMTGGSVSSADLSNTSNTGIDTSGVMNSAFIGTIQGFTASYTGTANVIDVSVVIGGITYTAQNVTSNPTSNTKIRFLSETGGYFDVTLRANQGLEVSDSAGASTFADKMDAAFDGVTFYQNRGISSYDTSGALLGSSVSFQTDDFSDVSIDNISVTAPSGSITNGTISFTIDGELYSAQFGLSDQLGAYSITRFVSASNSSKYIEFRNGGNALSMATDEDAADLEDALKEAFGVGEGAAALSFQVGATADDTLEVSIGNASTDSLFDGASLNVLSQTAASAASSALESAIAAATTIRANIGALQSRFNFASTNIQISIQNQDAARGELLDTDIAAESTAYATSQVKLQAGISVLAQANQQLQNLLKLIG